MPSIYRVFCWMSLLFEQWHPAEEQSHPAEDPMKDPMLDVFEQWHPAEEQWHPVEDPINTWHSGSIGRTLDRQSRGSGFGSPECHIYRVTVWLKSSTANRGKRTRMLALLRWSTINLHLKVWLDTSNTGHVGRQLMLKKLGILQCIDVIFHFKTWVCDIINQEIFRLFHMYSPTLISAMLNHFRVSISNNIASLSPKYIWKYDRTKTKALESLEFCFRQALYEISMSVFSLAKGGQSGECAVNWRDI